MRENHLGLDVAAGGIRGEPALAVMGGRVIDVGTNKFGGNFAVIGHGDNRESATYHLDSLYVKKGLYVGRGDPIGATGSTGSMTTGPHIHLEYRIGGAVKNPNIHMDRPIPEAR